MRNNVDEGWRRTPVDYCDGKVIYDKRSAQTAANMRYREAHVRLRIYQCPDCRGWHLTHTEFRREWR